MFQNVSYFNYKHTGHFIIHIRIDHFHWHSAAIHVHACIVSRYFLPRLLNMNNFLSYISIYGYCVLVMTNVLKKSETSTRHMSCIWRITQYCWKPESCWIHVTFILKKSTSKKKAENIIVSFHLLKCYHGNSQRTVSTRMKFLFL